MKKTKSFDFSPVEWEIIEHRLEADDAIYEAVFEYNKDPELQAVSRDQCYEACYGLLDKGRHVHKANRIEQACIKDAIEGSVFLVLADQARARPGEQPAKDQISHGKYMAYCRAANGIETKTGWRIPRT